MRLDHLLSKEHFLPGFGLVRGQYTGECSVLVAHGWNVDYSARLVWFCEYCFGVENRYWVGCAGHVVGYLRVRAHLVSLSFGMPAPVNSPVKGGVMGGWSLFENCTVDASICGQVFKGARWMPWHQEPMKDVGGHDSPRGAVNQALIRGFPNGETRQSSWAVTHA